MESLTVKLSAAIKIFIYVMLGVILGLIAIVGIYYFWSQGRIIPGVCVAGVPIGGLYREEAEKIIKEKIEPLLQKKVILSYKDRSFGVVLGAIGINPDYEATLNKVYELEANSSLFQNIRNWINFNRVSQDIKLQFKHNENTLDSFYRLLETTLAEEPVRAHVYVDVNGEVTFTPGKEGREVLREQLTGLLETAVSVKKTARIEIPVKLIKPALTANEIEKWSLNQVLGMYKTRYNPRLIDRSHNLKNAALAIDNVIVYPGQGFSFNTWVGPRLAETGYKEAPVVLNGKLVPGIGGGVCQVSTTLYNAVMLANLKVLKRQNHTIPSAYVPLGRDATVVYDGLDFMFENTLKTPILITAVVEPPYVRVAILGEKTDWESVSFKTETLATYPFKVKEIKDPTLESGKRVKESDGRKGYKVALYRIITYKDGTTKKTLENISIYPAQPEEYKVGTKATN
ncbi:MAG TPA: VanW family protein [Bacillota bacterium]|nr:VanW family protein [Bacillota bacterium]HOL09070.1 VanW family protein [Bacillota bacterium]HPO96745.1 VanW family protein [Bacillota bacterium]